MKPCTITVTNTGRKTIFTRLRGEHEVTVLETVITDTESGRVLNREIRHSAERDTLTFPVFYDDRKSPQTVTPGPGKMG